MNDAIKMLLLAGGGYLAYRLIQQNRSQQAYQPVTDQQGQSFWDTADVRTPWIFGGDMSQNGSGNGSGSGDDVTIPYRPGEGPDKESDSSTGQSKDSDGVSIAPMLFPWAQPQQPEPQPPLEREGKSMSDSDETQFSNMNLPRGIRNNNPGNIRHGDAWQGRRNEQSDDAFVQFKSPEYGIRALVKVLETYQEDYGLNTVEGIISRWAPPHENDTESYIDAVSRTIGVSPNAPLNIGDNATTRKLVGAIIKHENGQQPYTVAALSQGIRMAV